MAASVNNITNASADFSSVVSLNDLRLMVKLGVTEEERAIPQEVNISFKFYFKDSPQACLTDNIEDTVCYAEISEIARGLCHKKDFKLLEYLCYLVYKEARKKIAPDIRIWIKVEKCRPQIEGLVGSSAFEYTDV